MDLLAQFKKVKTFVFDVDGVLTDGSLWVMENNQPVRRMNIKDGYALQLAIKKGYQVVIISGGTSESVKERLLRLGVTDVYMGVLNKKDVLTNYVARHSLNLNEVLFMGDDIPDYRAMQLTGIPCAPANAAPEIRQIAKYISEINGGHGCVREVIEKVLKLNNHWELETEIASK